LSHSCNADEPPAVKAPTALSAAQDPAAPATEKTEKADNKPLGTGLSRTKPGEGPSVKVGDIYMVPYRATIPGTDAWFDMIPIPGGTYMMSSPEDEEGREDNEGPQVPIVVDPIWVGKYEVKWDEYKQYMELYSIFKEFEGRMMRKVTDANRADAVTAPTELYVPDHTFEYGDDDYQAAVTMTRYAAKYYTKWLAAVTGDQYRLPTEAEWEYAARGGTSTPYYFGNSIENGGEDHVWYFDTVETEGQQEVGVKKTNPFGLYDMLGNVAELVVDGYREDTFKVLAKKAKKIGGPLNATTTAPWVKEDSRAIARGGHWDSEAEGTRCASRLLSDEEEWKEEDPNNPKSPWWYTSDPARGVGFRLVRSFKSLDAETIKKFYEPHADKVIEHVDRRIKGGRGGWGLVDKDLPRAIRDDL
ncbi:MAG: formylglycine-generating enzyme family protein, partial [Planctomycetota bacterium]